MKKILFPILLAITFILPLSADIIYPDGHTPSAEPYQVRKLGRGLANLVSWPIEIPKAVFDATNDEGVDSAMTVTLAPVRGVTKSFLRLESGLRDVFYWGPGDEKPLFHLQPETLNMPDFLPGYRHQFGWETIDTPAPHFNPTELPSWHY